MSAQAKDQVETKEAGRGKMPQACARQFLKVAVELDHNAQRLELLGTAMVLVAGKAGVPFY